MPFKGEFREGFIGLGLLVFRLRYMIRDILWSRVEARIEACLDDLAGVPYVTASFDEDPKVHWRAFCDVIRGAIPLLIHHPDTLAVVQTFITRAEKYQ